ncbi:transposase [Xanthobacter flavus]|uniref:transposase n=1 Tax=Xanthobacter flavus TaxID=281 RepID=UPI00372CD3E3
MSRRWIGQESFGFGDAGRRHSSLDDLATLIDWACVDLRLADISCAAKGEPAWLPLALFKALLLAVWYDLSDVKLAEALDDRASFRRFCGFSGAEPTPERTAFVRFRKALTTRGLDEVLFDDVTAQLKANAVRVKTGTLVAPPSSLPPARATRKRGGSSTSASRRFMASRPMSVPTPTLR